MNNSHYTLEISERPVWVLMYWSLMLNVLNLDKAGEICATFDHISLVPLNWMMLLLSLDQLVHVFYIVYRERSIMINNNINAK